MPHKYTRLRMPLADRFWRHVEKTDGCWLWIGARNHNNYGRLADSTRPGHANLAHRIAWELTYGPIPDGMCVCHTCDNPPCVNPDHLWLGTHDDNMADRTAKGRDPLPPDVHIKMEIAAQIREEYAAGGVTHRVLSERYGIDQSSVTRLINGKMWCNEDTVIPGPPPQRWAMRHDCCIQCGTTAIKHKTHGYCDRCWRRERYRRGQG